jgi:hypothetical protein
MKKKLTQFLALATIILLVVMVLFARQASAGWIIRDGTAVNPLQVCRDGIYMGVGSQFGPGPVNVTAVLQAGGQELFNESYTLPENPVPEAALTHSDFFTEFWDGTFQPLAVGTKIYLEGGIEVPMVTVADCYLNPAVPQAGPGFTYQGYLNDSNSPADGSYDFTFSLHNAANGGAQIGSPITVDNLAVADGLFMTGLNFGTDAFNGEARWLQISVRPGNSGGPYTALNPRQSLAPAPYALHAVNIPEHDHFGETWIGNHNPLELTGSFNNAPLVINNVITNPNSGNTTGNGIAMDEIGGTGISMFSVGFTGVSVWSTGGDGMMVREASDDGFNICATGSNTCFTDFDIGSHGLEVGNAQDDGVHIISADGDGVHIEAAGSNAIEAYTGNAIAPTVYIENTSTATFFADQAGLVVVARSSTAETIEAINASSVEANVFAACSSDSVSDPTCSDFEFRVTNHGNVLIDGAYSSSGADYADMMPVSGDPARYNPGDVLIIGADGKIAKSTKPNDTHLAGVYSTSPAIVGDPRGTRDLVTEDGIHIESIDLSERENVKIVEKYPGHDLVPVALVGIVPTNVSAENGPIRPGDLLTTSATEGHAMKASPLILSGIEFYAPGTIIGKALEPHESGTGLIKVLVTLQ